LTGLMVYAVCVCLLLFGGRRIERMLELLNWIMVIAILGSLLVLCLVFATPGQFLGMGLGFFGFDLGAGRFHFLPEGADWFLLGAFAAYSGGGGVTNITLASWARDKGYGMGSLTGYIPTLVGGRGMKLAHTGTAFEPGPESLARWRGWWRIVRIDQWGIFFVGALAGMGLPGLLYTTAIPAGTDMRGLNVSSVLAVLLGWGLFSMELTEPIILLQLGANMAGLVMVLGALHILRINTTLLPEPLRPAPWRRVVLVLMAIFYGFFVALSVVGRLS